MKMPLQYTFAQAAVTLGLSNPPGTPESSQPSPIGSPNNRLSSIPEDGNNSPGGGGGQAGPQLSPSARSLEPMSPDRSSTRSYGGLDDGREAYEGLRRIDECLAMCKEDPLKAMEYAEQV